MKKTVLGVAMVVVFCITWWLVAGEAWQAFKQAKQASLQAEQAYEQATQRHAKRAYMPPMQTVEQAKQAFKQAEQAFKQAEQASIVASAHFRTLYPWGIGVGLIADVLLLVGVLVWQKITFKP